MELKAYLCKCCGVNMVVDLSIRQCRCQFCGTEYLLENDKVRVAQFSTTTIKHIYEGTYESGNKRLFENVDKLIDAGQASKAKLVLDKLMCKETSDYRTWLLLIKYEMSFFDSKRRDKEFIVRLRQYIGTLRVNLGSHDIGNYLVFKSLTDQSEGLTCCFIGKDRVISLPDFGFSKIVKFCTPEDFGVYDLDIGDGLTKIGKHALSDCQNLHTIAIPDSVHHIDFNAFEGCSNLMRIKFKFTSNALTDDNSAGLRDLLWDNRRLGASSLVAIIMRDITKIESRVFLGSGAITHITCKRKTALLRLGDLMLVFSDKLESVGAFAFSACSNLNSVELASTTEHICKNAFASCGKIANLEITSLNIVLESAVFDGFSKTQQIHFRSSKKQAQLWARDWKHGCKAKIYFAD